MAIVGSAAATLPRADPVRLSGLIPGAIRRAIWSSFARKGCWEGGVDLVLGARRWRGGADVAHHPEHAHWLVGVEVEEDLPAERSSPGKLRRAKLSLMMATKRASGDRGQCSRGRAVKEFPTNRNTPGPRRRHNGHFNVRRIRSDSVRADAADYLTRYFLRGTGNDPLHTLGGNSPPSSMSSISDRLVIQQADRGSSQRS